MVAVTRSDGSGSARGSITGSSAVGVVAAASGSMTELDRKVLDTKRLCDTYVVESNLSESKARDALSSLVLAVDELAASPKFELRSLGGSQLSSFVHSVARHLVAELTPFLVANPSVQAAAAAAAGGTASTATASTGSAATPHPHTLIVSRLAPTARSISARRNGSYSYTHSPSALP